MLFSLACLVIFDLSNGELKSLDQFFYYEVWHAVKLRARDHSIHFMFDQSFLPFFKRNTDVGGVTKLNKIALPCGYLIIPHGLLISNLGLRLESGRLHNAY